MPDIYDTMTKDTMVDILRDNKAGKLGGKLNDIRKRLRDAVEGGKLSLDVVKDYVATAAETKRQQVEKDAKEKEEGLAKFTVGARVVWDSARSGHCYEFGTVTRITKHRLVVAKVNNHYISHESGPGDTSGVIAPLWTEVEEGEPVSLEWYKAELYEEGKEYTNYFYG
jgi:hypothetical protein